MFMKLRRVLEVIAIVGLMAFFLGAEVQCPGDTSSQARPSLAGLQQQVDALQARLDSRPPTGDAFAGAEMFLLIPTIPGDAVNAAHFNWIDVLAFGIGSANPDGSPVFDEFVVVKQLDRATTALLAAARDSTLLASATIEICSQGECTLRYELTNVTVSSVGPGVFETVTLSYGEIEQTLDIFSEGGGQIGSVSSGPLDVSSLGGTVLGFASASAQFTIGSGNVDEISMTSMEAA